MIRKIFLLGISVFSICSANAESIVFDSCREPASWNINMGKDEKDEAKANLEESDNGLNLQYDFSAGQYIAVSPRQFLKAAEKFQLELLPGQDTQITYRIVDRSGRTFQAAPVVITGNKPFTLSIDDSQKFQRVWGGSTEARYPERPFRNIALLVNRNEKLPLKGTLLLKTFSGELKESESSTVTAAPIEKETASWKLRGLWFFPAEAPPLLLLECTPLSNVDALLEVTMPMPAKDHTVRFALAAANGRQNVIYRIPLPNGVNPRNSYQVKLSLETVGERVSFTASFTGKLASGINLGKPIPTTEIKHSRLGVNTHFIYPAYHGKKVREVLFRELRQGGFKWIRDGVHVDRDASGQAAKVRDLDLDFIRTAHANGIMPLLFIPMYADETLDNFLQRVEVIVRDTKEYVSVYELGNEPNNFGGWRKKYSGSWNGWDPNQANGVSQWVKEHTEYSNAAADKIKMLDPQATVIGLGSPSCTNFRALSLSVSKNLTGIVDHPYPWNMLPEMIPYSWSFEKRDGLKVGDAEGTLAGLYRSYAELFRRSNIKRSLWITEFGWSTMWINKDNIAKAHIYPGFSEEAQAEYLLRRYLEGLATPVVAHLNMYEFVDSGKVDPYDRQRNFGLLRHDFSQKPSYRVLSRLNALMHNAHLDTGAEVTETLESSQSKTKENFHMHGTMKVAENHGIRIYPYLDPETPGERLLGIWSMGPYSEANNNRVVGFTIKGWQEFTAPPIAINMLTGDTYDLPIEVRNGEIIVEAMSLKAPLLIKFFRNVENKSF